MLSVLHIVVAFTSCYSCTFLVLAICFVCCSYCIRCCCMRLIDSLSSRGCCRFSMLYWLSWCFVLYYCLAFDGALIRLCCWFCCVLHAMLLPYWFVLIFCFGAHFACCICIRPLCLSAPRIMLTGLVYLVVILVYSCYSSSCGMQLILLAGSSMFLINVGIDLHYWGSCFALATAFYTSSALFEDS